METQVDIIQRLVQRDMFLVTEEIFAYLNNHCLRNCELVSKTWYFAIRNDNIWKKRYDRVAKKRPHFYRSFAQYALGKIKNSEFFFKKLLWAVESNALKLPCNLKRRLSYCDLHITFLTMDDKRIVVGENYLFCVPPVKSSIIFVYDSFTLELECVFEAPGAGRIKYLQLQEDLLFGSFYSEKSIYVWNLESKQIVQKLQADILDQCVDGFFHAAHGLLISCYNVAAGVSFQKDIDGDAHLVVRRIHSPTDMKIEKKEHLPLWEINQVESNVKFFAVSLSFRVPESREIQLRSTSDFLVIQRIEMSPEYKFCAFHDGQLLTVDIFSSRIQIKFWGISNFFTGAILALLKTKISPETLTPSNRVSIHCGHLIISEPVRGAANLVEVEGMWKVHNVDCASIENNGLLFLHLLSDNINKPRIPKTTESWYKLEQIKDEIREDIYTFGNTQLLNVTPYCLFQKLL